MEKEGVNLLPCTLSDLEFIDTYIALVNQFSNKPITAQRIDVYDVRMVREAPRVAELLKRARSDIHRENVSKAMKVQFCKEIEAFLETVQPGEIRHLKQITPANIRLEFWSPFLEIVEKYRPSHKEVYQRANTSRQTYNKYFRAIIKHTNIYRGKTKQ